MQIRPVSQTWSHLSNFSAAKLLLLQVRITVPRVMAPGAAMARVMAEQTFVFTLFISEYSLKTVTTLHQFVLAVPYGHMVKYISLAIL